MKADEARKIYFEKYVDFEYYIRTIGRRSNLKTAKVSLHDLIDMIANTTDFATFGIKKSLIVKHKNRRNWLAHMHKNTNVSESMKKDFDEIDNVNKELIVALNGKK